MKQEKEYFVFISYSSLDNKWAIWLKHELDHYHLPASFNGRNDVRDNLREVFRDRDELSAGPLWDEQVFKALSETANLIVICSPNAVNSDPVNEEIKTFIALGKEDHIFPFIVEGNTPSECFPPSLNHSKLGGDVNKDGGRDAAFVKVVAGMLNVNFSSLWNRYEIEKAEEERLQREEKERMQRLQSRLVAEKAKDLNSAGESLLARRLLLNVLPKDLQLQNRPKTIEAESVFRDACLHENTIIRDSVFPWAKPKVSPDGKMIAYSADDNTIRLWNLRNDRCEKKFLGHTKEVYGLCFSLNGEYLVSASWDRTVKLWNVQTGECVRTFTGHSQGVMSAAISPDNKIVASVSRYSFLVWNVEDGKCISNVDGFFDHLDYSPDGRFVAVSSGNSLQIWDAKKWELLLDFAAHRLSITAIGFSPKGKKVMTCSNDGYICLWDPTNGNLLKKMGEGDSQLVDASYGSNGAGIIACDNSNIYIWHIPDGERIFTWTGQNNKITKVTISPDMWRIVSASMDYTISVTDLSDDRQCKIDEYTDYKEEDVINFDLLGTEDANKECRRYSVFDNTGEKVAIVKEDCSLVFENIQSQKTITILKEKANRIQMMIFSHNSKYLVAAFDDGHCCIWEFDSGKCLKTLYGHTKKVNLALFSPDDTLIASASDDKTVRIWDVCTGKCLHTLVKNSAAITNLSFSYDGKMLCSFGYDLDIWEVTTGALLNSLQHNAIFFPEGNYLFSIGIDDEINIIKAPSGEIVYSIKIARFGINIISFQRWLRPDVCFSNDGSLFAVKTMDCKIQIYKTATGKLFRTLIGHEEKITGFSFSPDNNYFVSSSIDKSLRIWDIESSQCLQTIITTLAESYVTFDSTGKHIIQVSSNGSFMVWKFPSLQELIDETYDRFKDTPLTPEERKKYYLD